MSLRPAFTLLELVVVIALISVLIGLLLSAVQRVREAAARTRCGNNLRQIGFAHHQYHDSKGKLPPGISRTLLNGSYPNMNWHTHLLPYMEQGPLWYTARDAYRQTPEFAKNPPHVGLARPMPSYTCSADGWTGTAQMTKYGFPVALTDYLGNAGLDEMTFDGVLYRDSETRIADIVDGTSQTLLVGERPPSPDFRFGWSYAGVGQKANGSLDSVLGVREINDWGAYPLQCPPGPYSYQTGYFQDLCSVFHFWSFHPGGANFAFADGSVRFLTYEANPIMPALASRSGGEIVRVPD